MQKKKKRGKCRKKSAPVPRTSGVFGDNAGKANQDLLEAHESKYSNNEYAKEQIERFIEISKHFSSPLRKTASYMCENSLVTYTNSIVIPFYRGVYKTHQFKIVNITLEPVIVKFYKIIPDLEQIKFLNIPTSRCQRIPPGLSLTLNFIFQSTADQEATTAKIIFVATRKSTTPCYQICEVNLIIEPAKLLSAKP